jgi:hypothetical protein
MCPFNWGSFQLQVEVNELDAGYCTDGCGDNEFRWKVNFSDSSWSDGSGGQLGLSKVHKLASKQAKIEMKDIVEVKGKAILDAASAAELYRDPFISITLYEEDAVFNDHLKSEVYSFKTLFEEAQANPLSRNEVYDEKERKLLRF